MSIAKNIAQAIADRIGIIKNANGYLTDAGLRVYRGRVSLDPAHVPCLVLAEGSTNREDEKASAALVKIGQPYTIEGHVPCDPDHPNDAAHDVISDIKRALFGSDLTYGGKVYKIHFTSHDIGPRPDGTALVSGSVSISISYVENLAAP